MPVPHLVAVLDVGKTNVKMVLRDVGAGTEVLGRSTPNRVLEADPYPHYDVEAVRGFCLDTLAETARLGLAPDALVVTAHGASGAVIGADDLALPVLDYEHGGPDEVAADYDRIRPDFAETCSPRLPAGLNLGAQLFWQHRRFPQAFGRARAILTYPQFWAWWLTGVAATEVTSFGAHTDFWDPRRRRLSSLAARAGFASLLAPPRRAWEPLGPLRPDLATRLGFDRPIAVLTGIHDSNASLLPYRLSGGDPMTVISTGTWVIAFALGAPLAGLDPARDTLANVDLFGAPVPSARFMAGREFDLIAGPGERPDPDPACLARVLEQGIMVLPTLVPGSGPFPARRGAWEPAGADQNLGPGERLVAASLYAGLVTAECLGVLGASGPSVIEGPFGRNPLVVEVLAALTRRPVLVPHDDGGSAGGAALLATIGTGGPRRPSLSAPPARYGLGGSFARYAALWAERAARPDRSTGFD